MALNSTTLSGPASAMDSWLMKGRDALGNFSASASPAAPPMTNPTATPTVVHVVIVAVATAEKPSSCNAQMQESGTSFACTTLGQSQACGKHI